jgi:pimeloyl-ACP methyl ester carboxylesterase
VRNVIGSQFSDADIFTPQLPFHRFICFEPVEKIVIGLMNRIDALVAGRKALGDAGYEEIILVGHSFGAVIARKIALLAYGEQLANGDAPAPFEPEFANFRTARHWASLIDRIVLLAGMNRGWSASDTRDWITSVGWSLGQVIGEVGAFFFGMPTIFAIRKGAPFLVQTRLQWLALMNPNYGARPDLIVVQLLGAIDDCVSPDDYVDYAVDDQAFKSKDPAGYFYLEVPESGHDNIVDMGGPSTPATTRANIFRDALTLDRVHLEKKAIPRKNMSDSLPPDAVDYPVNVVFVIHGIRDKGFWTQKIARKIKESAPADREFKSFTESYGYFAILPFLAPLVRRRKVEWLMDRYVEVRARYPHPGTKFFYVGHSNGTYLAADALHTYPALRFERIVFAGSVVRKDYDWAQFTTAVRPRVKEILNFVATSDWVVALFPKALQPIRWFNLGSAGHDGFDAASVNGPVHQFQYIRGPHDAALVEENWPRLADFIVSGALPDPKLQVRRQSWFWKAMGMCSYMLFPLLAIALLALGVALFLSIFGSAPCEGLALQWKLCAETPDAKEAATWAGKVAAARTALFFLYLWAVHLFVTRF